MSTSSFLLPGLPWRTVHQRPTPEIPTGCVIDLVIQRLIIGAMKFEWDTAKNRRNRDKHGVSFEDAVRVFEVEDACLEFFDEEHSDLEERFITIGPIDQGIVLVVWTERAEGAIRVISARPATPQERRLYQHHLETSR